MKKVSLAFLFAAVLFTGCAEKSSVIEADEVAGSVGSSNGTSDNTSTTSGFDKHGVAVDDIDKDTVSTAAQSVYFSFDKYEIQNSEKAKIVFNTQVLSQSNLRNKRVTVEGNCDEWGSDEYNFALGLKRAKAAKQALIVQGIDASRLNIVSYGESNFVCTERTRACWGKNRRADFKIYK